MELEDAIACTGNPWLMFLNEISLREILQSTNDRTSDQSV